MAKLLVSAGGFDQDSAGETLSPKQFGFDLILPTYFLSSIVPSLNDDDVVVNGSAASPPQQDAARKAATNSTRRPAGRCTGMISSPNFFRPAQSSDQERRIKLHRACAA